MDEIREFVYIMFQYLYFRTLCYVFKYLNSLKSTSSSCAMDSVMN